MKAITIALLVPAALAIWTGTAAAQGLNAAFEPPDTTHITLNQSGGLITAEAANPEDPANAQFIQTRLALITMTGLPELKPLGKAVKYNFEATWDGARIQIRASDPAALHAIHDFLRLKIAEWQTGDTGQVE
jgi:hypothetical protein